VLLLPLSLLPARLQPQSRQNAAAQALLIAAAAADDAPPFMPLTMLLPLHRRCFAERV
jgi:hypothetical protein